MLSITIDSPEIQERFNQAITEEKIKESLVIVIGSKLDNDSFDDTIDTRIDNYLEDHSNDITDQIEKSVDDVIDKADIEDKVNKTIDDFDIGKAVEDAIDNHIRDEHCSVEDKVTELTNEFIEGIQPSLNERVDAKVNELTNSNTLIELINQRLLCLDSVFKEVIVEQVKNYLPKIPMLQDVKPAVDSSNKINVLAISLPSDKYDLIVNLLTALKIEYSVPSPNF